MDGLENVESGERRKTPSVVARVGGAALAILFLLGVTNLIAPHAFDLFLGDAVTPTPEPTTSKPRAAIVDQTGLSFPSESFIAEARSLMETAGYTVTYYPPEEVTISLYRSLPGRGYDLVLFQSHATSEVVVRGGQEASGEIPPGPFLFTTEPYEKQRHLALQMTDQVRASQLFYEDAPELFAVGPAFVRRSMQGFFPGTTVIIGGCQSLAAPDLARSLLEKGASVVVGWDGMVNLSHNNEAVLYLLEQMLREGASAGEAVDATMAAVGQDPQFQSELKLLE